MRNVKITALLALAALGVAGCSMSRDTAAPASASAAQARFASDRITVAVEGSGRDVILIPGLSSSPGRAWRSTVDALPGFRYHLVHVRGFAGLDAGANATGPVSAPVAAEIARYISETGIERPAVIGHSMGGTIGLMLAARHPQAVGRLMVVDMLPFIGAMFGGPGATVESVRPVAETIRTAMSGAPNPQGEKMLESMINGMVNTQGARAAILADSRSSDRATTANAYYELITTDLRPELARIKAPLTVLYVTPAGAPVSDAQMDGFYKTSYAGVTGARLIRVPDSAHFIQVDAPDRFRSEVRAFLE